MKALRQLIASLMAMVPSRPVSHADAPTPTDTTVFNAAFEPGFSLIIDDALKGRPPDVISLTSRT